MGGTNVNNESSMESKSPMNAGIAQLVRAADL